MQCPGVNWTQAISTWLSHPPPGCPLHLSDPFAYPAQRFSFFLNYTFYLQIIVDSHAIVRYNTERSCVLFTLFLPMITSCKTVVRYHNQDTEIMTLMQSRYRMFPKPRGSLVLPFIVTPTSLLSYLLLNPWPPLTNPVLRFSKQLSAQAPGPSTPLLAPVGSRLLS